MQDNKPDAAPAEIIAALFMRHPLWEDALALLLGTAMVALGIAFYSHAGLLTGGTVGLAFLFKYLADWPFGLVFFALNLPFYLLAIWRMGWAFTLRTFCAVALVSLLAELTPHWIGFAELNIYYAALFGGFAMGVGLLMLFRHRASLGGVNILALYLQERFGLRAGAPACRGRADGHRCLDRARRAVRGSARQGAAVGAGCGGAQPGIGDQPPRRPLHGRQLGSFAVSYAAAPEPVLARSKARGVKFGHSK